MYICNVLQDTKRKKKFYTFNNTHSVIILKAYFLSSKRTHCQNTNMVHIFGYMC